MLTISRNFVHWVANLGLRTTTKLSKGLLQNKLTRTKKWPQLENNLFTQSKSDNLSWIFCIVYQQTAGAELYKALKRKAEHYISQMDYILYIFRAYKNIYELNAWSTLSKKLFGYYPIVYYSLGTRVIYDRIWKRKNYFEIPTF